MPETTIEQSFKLTYTVNKRLVLLFRKIQLAGRLQMPLLEWV